MLAAWLVSAITTLSTAQVDALPPESPTQADLAFTELADEWWQDAMRRNPLLATSTGLHDYNDRLPEVTMEAIASEAEALRGFLHRLERMETKSLSRENQINYEIVRRKLRDDLAEFQYKAYLIPITNREGFHISFPDLRQQMPLNTVEDFQDYISRLAAFGHYADQHIELMRRGVELGYTLPSAVLTRFRDPIETHVVDNPTESLFYEPFREMPPSISLADADRLRQAAVAAIDESVIPGYERFLKFMEQEYVPAARGSLGASALPDGREFYRHRVQQFTTVDYSPEEVHAIGLAEVARIREEMKEIIREVGFTGDVRAFADSLRTDTRFQPTSADHLMKEAALILKRMDGELPRLFRTLPRTPYGLKPIPEYIAPQTTSAYYMPPTGDGSRAGFYYLNTYDLKSRPLYELEALSLHEAVPGHHLQLALQQELTALPPYRRFASFTAFIEGWALYAERLGLEVGFYKDPYSNYGRLTYEMWRACRLVVDTGIHYLGWSREQAIEFMANNTALSMHNIRAEVDRYIAWPGQALGYKIGELQIRELRADAEQALAERFDLREFHEVVLSNGAIPLDVLKRNVRDWIVETQANSTNASASP